MRRARHEPLQQGCRISKLPRRARRTADGDFLVVLRVLVTDGEQSAPTARGGRSGYAALGTEEALLS